MKLAVLISGEYRKFDVCRKTMNFLNNADIDVYVSTWDKTIYSNKLINLYTEELVTEERILKDLKRDATIKIDNHSSLDNMKYNSKMINRWLTGFELIKNSGIHYDYIIVMRPDLFFENIHNFDLNFLEKYKDPPGFIWANNLSIKKLADVMFMSSYENIQKLFNQTLLSDWNTSTEKDWHVWWYNYVNNIFSEIIDVQEFGSFTFCRLWANINHTFLNVLDIHHDWRDLRLLDQCSMWGDTFAKKVWPDHILVGAKEKLKNGHFNRYLKK